jgi:hypothetical protein
VAGVLEGTFRRDLAAELAASRSMGHALRRLRDGLRANVLATRARRIDLDAPIRHLDALTRRDGFHALHDWNGKAERFHDDTIPVEVLSFAIEQRGHVPADPAVPAMLVDYYLVYVLALMSLRVWDQGDVNRNLNRLTMLLDVLQGPGGSGHRFAADAETLMLIATSHYEPDERGYARLLERASALDAAHQACLGLVHATCMGGHLRFGFEATYNRDTLLLRNDNVVDYPWLMWGLAALMREYVRLREEGRDGLHRDVIVEGILNGLTPDANAVLSRPPACLAPLEAARLEFCEGFARHRDDLVADFERLRPTDRAFSPLSLFFNFSHNVLKGAVIDALLWGEAWTVSLNDLLTGLPADAPGNEARLRLATTLMSYARANPDIIRGRRMPVIVYDPVAGRRAYRIAMAEIRT